jgi:septum formation topological specificity factor MinE
MTPGEIGTLIIQRWRCETPAAAIMIQLICLGAPLKKKDVLAVIRRYVETNSENTTYRGKR